MALVERFRGGEGGGAGGDGGLGGGVGRLTEKVTLLHANTKEVGFFY